MQLRAEQNTTSEAGKQEEEECPPLLSLVDALKLLEQGITREASLSYLVHTRVSNQHARK